MSAVGLLMTITFLAEVMLCRVYIVSEVSEKLAIFIFMV
jgi:hypothetical protein